MKKTFLTLTIAAGTLTLALASNPSVPEGTLPAGTPERYDSLLSTWRTGNVTSLDTFFRDFIELDADSTLDLSQALPDSVYAARLQKMISPIHLPYNDVVKRYLYVYTNTRRSTMARILGLSQFYFPMIEQELSNAGLPIELRMLPVIESALCPTAVSRVGATGLWQFMYTTGKNYGLEITSFVDERRDPVAATRAACRFLAELYRIYGDWTLAIAAYNCGPGNVNKALKRAGEGAKTYWDIYPYLPKETRGYIPSFVAATYAYNYHKQHNINPVPMPLPLSTDTIRVNRLMHLEQVASTIDTPMEVLRTLNPQYKMDIIPAIEKTYCLTLPSSQCIKYIERQDSIHAKDSLYLAQYLKTTASPAKQAQYQISSITHKVKKGEVLGSIARKYGVTVSQLMKWNRIKSANSLRVGQVLEIHR